ncbi:hypothetical protein Chor_016235 [Crotalus horridus]
MLSHKVRLMRRTEPCLLDVKTLNFLTCSFADILAMATFPASMTCGTIIVIPSNGAASGLPGVALQASGATPYLQYGAQQLGISTSAPQQVPQKGPMERVLSAEAKVLGAVQIMIGLIHIGFGAVAIYLYPYDLTVSGTGGYPFWGGLFFISSGSLCVAAANHPNQDLVKSSVGLNITSAIMAVVGIILYLCEMIISTISLMAGQGYLNGGIVVSKPI